MVALILQVSGAILLAKGLIFRREFDVFMNVFSFIYIIDTKNNGRMVSYYSESILSKFGVGILILGYFLPAIGLEYDIEKLSILYRLIYGLAGIIVLCTLIILLSNSLGKKKASKVDQEYLLNKHSAKAAEQGFRAIGDKE